MTWWPASAGRAKPFDVDEAVASTLAELSAVATPERAQREQAYLKSELAFLGASVPQVRRVATRLRDAHRDVTREQLHALIGALWGRGVHELRLLAVELLRLEVGRLTPHDAALVERLVREARTWALVDGLAVRVAGALAVAHPEAMDPVLRRWAADDDLWLRRASLLAHLPGLRQGDGDFDRFTSFADAMLDEQEFFIRKAIGWVLREAGKRDPAAVTAWLEPRLHRASGVTVREAVKHLPEDDRQRLQAWSRPAERRHRGGDAAS